jgi:hypothetical protein
MAEFNQTFNPSEIPEDDRNFEPIPAGTYRLQVIESKIEPTSTGSGEMMTLTLEVIEGPYDKRRIWDRLNIVNQNPDAQRIAQRNLADLCLAIGVTQLKDTEQLHHKPFSGRVTVQPDRTGQYGPQNRVRYSVGKPGQPPAGKAGTTAAGAKPAGAKPAGAKPPARPWGSGGAPKAPAAQVGAKADLEDEIPF